MRPRWEDLNARARGLSTRLLPESELDRLAKAADLEGLSRSLPADLRPEGGAPVTARRLDRALARAAAARLGLLARWAGPSRQRPLTVLYREMDRRCVRILLRGAAAALPPERRLDGVLPTPALPERVLREAGRADDPDGVLAVLEGVDHPFGAALRPFAATGRHGTADLFVLEIRLSGVWARDAVRGAGRDRGLRRFVRRAVDLENAWTALVSPPSLPEAAPAGGVEPPDGGRQPSPGDGGPSLPAARLYLEGGDLLTPGGFRAVVETPDRGRKRELLAQAFAGTPLSRLFGDPTVGPAELEIRALEARVAEERRAAREDPLGPPPLLEYVLRLRRQVSRLRRAVWGLEMGAPAPARSGGREAA